MGCQRQALLEAAVSPVIAAVGMKRFGGAERERLQKFHRLPVCLASGHKSWNSLWAAGRHLHIKTEPAGGARALASAQIAAILHSPLEDGRKTHLAIYRMTGKIKTEKRDFLRSKKSLQETEQPAVLD